MRGLEKLEYYLGWKLQINIIPYKSQIMKLQKT